MEQTKINLAYIKSTLQVGGIQSDMSMLQMLLDSTIEAIRTTPFYYEVKYTMKHSTEHMQTYREYAKRYKTKLLSDLEEIQREFTCIPMGSEKRCLNLLTEILATDLYRAAVQRKIDKFTPKTGKPLFENIAV